MNLEKLAVCMKLGQELLGMFVFSKAYSSSWFRLAAGFHFKEGTDHADTKKIVCRKMVPEKIVCTDDTEKKMFVLEKF